MGFLPDVRRSCKHCRRKRQTLFFSATIPPAIAELRHRDCCTIPSASTSRRRPRPAIGITQTVYSIEQMRKTDLLRRAAQRQRASSARSRSRAPRRGPNRLAARACTRHNMPAERIHGDRSQAQRTRALADFKRGKFRVLVATDIAARGIDIVELGHVVNFDVPMVPEDYIHRVGRTARAQARRATRSRSCRPMKRSTSRRSSASSARSWFARRRLRCRMQRLRCSTSLTTRRDARARSHARAANPGLPLAVNIPVTRR